MSLPWPRGPLLLAALLMAGPSLAVGRPVPLPISELTALRARESARSADSLARLRTQKHELGLDDGDDFRAAQVQTDRFGHTHTRVQQLHQGVPVWGGAAITHLDASGVELPVTTEGLFKDVRVDVHPALDAPAAVSVALLTLAPHGPPSQEPRAELVIYPRTQRVSLSPGNPLGARNAVDFRQQVVGYRLAWSVHTALDNVWDGLIRKDFLIDAQTGEVLQQWNALQTVAAVGTGHSLYGGDVPLSVEQNSSGQFELRDLTRTGGAGLRTLDAQHLSATGDTVTGVLYTDADNTWGDGHTYTPGGPTADDNGQTAAVDAHFGLLATWDFYQEILGRYGLDDRGTPTFNRVHVGTNFGNAFWDDACYCMNYGDGDPADQYFKQSITVLDVTGHELSHGVTAQTDALIYAGESGGLNESTSDIFGTMVEFWVRGGRRATIGERGGNWLIGEALNSVHHPVRYLYKPSLDGKSPDAWSPELENADVHYSSGPMNRAFYFLSQGAQPASAKGDYSSDYLPEGMTGVGNDAAAAIWYRAISTYLYPSSDYVSARTAALRSAEDLFGAASKEYHAVENAFAAINVGYTAAAHDDRVSPSVSTSVSGSAPMLQLNANATDNVGVTQVDFYVDSLLMGTVRSMPFQVTLDTTLQDNGTHQLLALAHDQAGNTATSTPVTFNVTNSFTQLLQNPGFEQKSRAGWVAFPANTLKVPSQGVARTGVGAVGFLGNSESHKDTLYQDVSIPAGVRRAALTFWLSLAPFKDLDSTGDDTLVVQVRDTSGTVLQTLATFSAKQDASFDWVERSFDVTGFAGQTVRIYLEAQTQQPLGAIFLLDDFQLRVLSGADTEKPRVTLRTKMDSTAPRVSLFADVLDNGYVGAVQFLVDGTSLGSTPTSFMRVLELSSLTEGVHTLVARATDAAGNTSDSAPMTLAVDSKRTQLVVNPSFDDADPGAMGRDAWQVDSPDPESASIVSLPGGSHSGLGVFNMWSKPKGNDSTVRQTVTIPADATSATYRFWLLLKSDAFSDGARHHFFTAKVRSASGADLRTLETFSNLDVTGPDYLEHIYDLSAFKGQTVQLFFEANTLQPVQVDDGATLFLLDDVTLQTTHIPDTQPPELSASVIGTYGTLQLIATVNDSVVTSSLDFLVDGVSVATLHDVEGSHTVPLATSSASNGMHVLTVNARDVAGNQSTVTVPFAVANPTVSDTSAPTLTASVTGEFDTTQLHATASDDTGVTQVEFYIDNALQGRVLSAPYERPFDTTPLAAGEHTLLAVAYDAYGHSTSATVKFTREGLLLEPTDHVLLAALETYAFTATPTPTASVALPLSWRVDEGPLCGSVTPAGVYKAPEGQGFCHVRVSSPSGPRLDAVATVRVYSGDLNADHVVDGEDMGLLAASYGTSGAGTPSGDGADLDASLFVDDLDVTLFLSLSQFGR